MQHGTTDHPTRTVFLFPGQGAQEVGMGQFLYREYPAARPIFDAADNTLGFPLCRLMFEGPAEELNGDLTAQLAVHTTCCALVAVLREGGVHPDIVSGYSSGFYGAMYAAGCFGFSESLVLVRRAGELLAEAGGHRDGAMAVIFGLPEAIVAEVCSRSGDVVVAISNTPSQIIISGHRNAVARAMEHCRAEGALDMRELPAAAAYHSPHMDVAAQRFLDEIDPSAIRDATVPVLSYHRLEIVRSASELFETMAAQLCAHVRWVDLIRKLAGGPRESWLEVGPGAVISRTVRWTDRTVEIRNTATQHALKDAIDVLAPCR